MQLGEIVKVDIEISEDIIKLTTKCMHDFSCLNSGKDCLCSVEEFPGNSILFVKGDSANKRSCGYCMHIGESFVCNCPIRNEIYRRYLT